MGSNRVDSQISVSPPDSPSVQEEHFSPGCEYVKYTVQTEEGSTAYVWLRKCVCCKYLDKSYLAVAGKLELVNQDGVDIHFNEHCYWESLPMNGVYLLKRHCFEGSDMGATGPGDVNRVR